MLPLLLPAPQGNVSLFVMRTAQRIALVEFAA
jgi:hypothetical protein